VIFTEGLTKCFDDFTAVEGVNLAVSAGQVLALLGPNGAGKTTTVRMLNSILTPTRGTAVVAGYDVIKDPQKVRANVGVLTELHGLYGRMRADEYLLFFGKLYRLPESVINSRKEDLLQLFGLAQDRGKRLGEYSKGMRQKLALVRALLHNPHVLLLDEPTSAMDPESARVVRDAIKSLRSNDRAVILCTHNLMEAEELADRVAIIRRGKILVNDTVQGLKMNYSGPPEFEARFAEPVDGVLPDLPPGVDLSGRGDLWLRFKVKSPGDSNPQLINQLSTRLRMLSFFEVQKSLEEAYLNVMGSNGGKVG
jgi:ABC-2 type transport system ATP-binding protein